MGARSMMSCICVLRTFLYMSRDSQCFKGFFLLVGWFGWVCVFFFLGMKIR